MEEKDYHERSDEEDRSAEGLLATRFSQVSDRRVDNEAPD